MKIEILGSGCPKCEQLGLDAEVSKVTDIVEIANRGVMMTPALSVDGEIKLVGKIATPEELKPLFAS